MQKLETKNIVLRAKCQFLLINFAYRFLFLSLHKLYSSDKCPF